MARRDYSSLWLRWVLANAVAELVGLGSTFIIGASLLARLTEGAGLLPALLGALAMTSSGLVEGTVVGLAQWWAMNPEFPSIMRRSWVVATVVGALAAWFLGSLPMTLGNLSSMGEGPAAAEPEGALMLMLTAAMGLAAGLILGLPQWRVFRRSIPQAWLWLPANSLAWGAGMPVIFNAVDRAFLAGSVGSGIVVMAIALLITGSLVGAIHGAVLVRFARYRLQPTT